MKTYIVSQTFETLGDPVPSKYASLLDAEMAAAELRDQIAVMVSEMETPDPDEYGTKTGSSVEVEAWANANELADGDKYGMIAGGYIANRAVEITECE